MPTLGGNITYTLGDWPFPSSQADGEQALHQLVRQPLLLLVEAMDFSCSSLSIHLYDDLAGRKDCPFHLCIPRVPLKQTF